FRSNGGGADILGLELELAANLRPGLEVGLLANWNDAQLSEDNPIPESGLDGDRIPYTPEFSFTLRAEQTRPLFDQKLNGFLGADLNYVGDRNTELRPTNPLNLELDSYSLLHVRAGVEADTWSAMLSVNNLLDDDTVIDVFRILPGLTPDGFIPLQPRTVVLSVNKFF
ncbi:MAG TPA: TonB-dependent receptor, partial [Woeseiaceae bacterium]|nr:TonB-dependent receptor [Woeseiaceae bacterium]